MIPHQDLKQLIQYYKGELTENALLNKAATLAAKKHVLLANPQLPPTLVNAQTKPLSQELTKLTKRIRQFPGGVGVGAPGGPPGEEEEEAGDLVTGPVEQWLKRMIKGSPSTPKPPITPATTKGKAATTSKIVKKGSPSTSRSDIQSRLEALRERRKTLEKKVAESSWAKGKGPAREVERLKPLPGWEDWAEAKSYDVDWITTVTKDGTPHPEEEEKGCQTETVPTRRGCGHSKMDR